MLLIDYQLFIVQNIYVCLLVFLGVRRLFCVGVLVVGIVGSSHGEKGDEDEELKKFSNYHFDFGKIENILAILAFMLE